MRCPAQDGELVEKSMTNADGLAMHVAQCPNCKGWWLDAFTANYLNPDAIQEESGVVVDAPPQHYACSTCGKSLIIVREESIPQHVIVWKCGEGHGYYFPGGELPKFKRAQEAKLQYHKLWGIPLPNVKSVLLAALVLLIVSSGLVLTLREVQRTQRLESSAQEMIVSQSAIVTPELHSAVIAATTSSALPVTLHIDSLNKLTRLMDTQDSLIHTIAIGDIPSGTYEYYFTTEEQGEVHRSSLYSFTMP